MEDTTFDSDDVPAKSGDDQRPQENGATDGRDGEDDKKKKMMARKRSRQFTFDERDEDEEDGIMGDHRGMTPLQQFTFDEGN